MVLQTHKLDDLVTCPLDDAHRILKSRMQFHIVRCLKNHTLETKIRCPWNSLHFVERCEYLDHCHNKCDDLANVMGSRIVTDDEKGVDVASIPVCATNGISNSSTEDWDAEPCVGTYDPLKRTEDRPILRGSIGLSKAKKKEFRLQERRRHQQLDEVLPIQIKTAAKPTKKADVAQSCRIPHNQSFAMSADTSMIDELNSSKMSDDCDKVIKLPENLRQPHGLSPGLFYKTDEDNEFAYHKKKTTLFDTQFEAFPDDNSETCVSSTSSRSANIEAMRKLMEGSAKTSEKHSASVTLSEMMKKSNDEPTNVEELNLQDEAACLPPIIPTPPEKDDVDELTEELANLETMERQINEKKAEILQKMSKNGNRNLNKYNVEAAKENYPNNCKQQNGFNGVNRKCAAALGNPIYKNNSPTLGSRRGTVLNFEAFKNLKPNGNPEHQQGSAETLGSNFQNDNPVGQ